MTEKELQSESKPSNQAEKEIIEPPQSPEKRPAPVVEEEEQKISDITGSSPKKDIQPVLAPIREERDENTTINSSNLSNTIQEIQTTKPEAVHQDDDEEEDEEEE